MNARDVKREGVGGIRQVNIKMRLSACAFKHTDRKVLNL